VIIVGIGHKARQGKDQVTKFLLEMLGRRGIDARKYSFAAGVYTLCRVQHGMTKKDPKLLQDVAMWHRGTDPDIWVNNCLAQIEDDQPEIAIIPDTRFLNEVGKIRERGGLLIRVRRTIDGQPFIADDRPADHRSETELNDFTWDVSIENDGTLDDLKRMTAHVAQALLQ
jgi:hypothetical protein